MTNYYNVLMPREYTTKDGATKSAFTKIGVAFPIKGKDGFTVTLEAVPMPQINKTGKLECKLLLMLPLEGDKPEPKHESVDDATKGDAIPF